MKFAFSTLACPKWDFETIAANASQYGYDGVEIRGFLNESVLTAANVFLSTPDKIRSLFDRHNLAIPCLSSSVAYAANRRADAQAASDVKTFVDAARALGSPLVKIFDTKVRPGQTRAEAASAMAQWLVPLGDYAAENGVGLVIENSLSFRNAKELWLILEMANHPAINVCWDLFNAAVIGESPATSVPTLNHRIQYVHVKDATLGPLGALYTKLGEGSCRVDYFLKRLMGIGYNATVTFEWEKAWLPGLAEPEEVLPDAITKLRLWTKPQLEPEAPVAATPVAAAKH